MLTPVWRRQHRPSDANPFRKFDEPDRIVLKGCLWAAAAVVLFGLWGWL